MSTRRVWMLAGWIVLAALLAGATTAALRVRRPIGPGLYYPADPAQLYTAVSTYLNEAEVEPRAGRLVGLIVPSSAYQYSGAVAAHGYKLLKQGQYDRVIILTPFHKGSFRGGSIPSVDVYRTPFGDVPLDYDAITTLTYSSLYALRALVYRQGAGAIGRGLLHEVEYGDEVQLPFLQLQLGEFKLVPIVVGQLQEKGSRFDTQGFNVMVERLRKVINDRTLIVTSSNFTQYGPEYAFTPFSEDIPKRLEALDTEAFNYITARDFEGFKDYVVRTRNLIPGRLPIAIMMEALPPDSVGVVLKYDTSGRLLNDWETSVSYAAIAFFDPTQPPAEQKPVKGILAKPAGEKKKEEPASASNTALPPVSF